MATKKTKETELMPLGDRVLIREIEEKQTKTESGIYLPESANQDKNTKKGKVIAVGTGSYQNGVRIPMNVKQGDTVLWSWGDKISLNDEDVYMVRESEIIARIK